MAGLIFLWNQPHPTAQVGQVFRVVTGGTLRPRTQARRYVAVVAATLRPRTQARCYDVAVAAVFLAHRLPA